MKICLDSEGNKERIRLRMGWGGYAEFLPIINPYFYASDLDPALRNRLSLRVFLADHRSAFRPSADDLKECPGCERHLPKSEFYRDSNKSDRLYKRCKMCVREDRRRIKRENRKQCYRCRRILPRDGVHFHRDRSSPDGLGGECKVCYQDRCRARAR